MSRSARLVVRYKTANQNPQQLGEAAFKKGLSRVPAHDPALMNWLRENPGPGVTLKALQQWQKGWDRANLRADV